jgi:hypothetical protein
MMGRIRITSPLQFAAAFFPGNALECNNQKQLLNGCLPVGRFLETYNPRAESMDILHTFASVEACQTTSVNGEHRNWCVKYTRFHKRLFFRCR